MSSAFTSGAGGLCSVSPCDVGLTEQSATCPSPASSIPVTVLGSSLYTLHDNCGRNSARVPPLYHKLTVKDSINFTPCRLRLAQCAKYQ